MIDRSRPKLWRYPSKLGGKYAFLFVFLLADIILYPYAGASRSNYEWFRPLTLLVTAASVYAVSFRRLTWIVALIVAVPVTLHRFLAADIAASNFARVGLLLSFGFDVFIVVAIFRRVFGKQAVTTETVFGAVSIYLMVGFAFTRLYLFLVAFQPGAFYLDPVLNRHTLPNSADLVFYSFATMTSLGAPGISPLTDAARSLSVIEAILGILYLGVLVSQLSAMRVPQMARERKMEGPSEGGEAPGAIGTIGAIGTGGRSERSGA